MAARNPPNRPQPAAAPPPPPPPRRRGLPRGTIALWLAVIGLAAFFVPLNLIATAIRNDTLRLNSEAQLAQRQLTSVPTLAPDVQQLATQVAQLEVPAQEIKNVQATITAGRVDWRTLMTAIGGYDPNQLVVSSLVQTSTQVILSGCAANDAAVTAYVRALENSNLFSRVVVQSIRAIQPSTATLTATPALTPTATVSGAVSLGDMFEIDDFTPKDIVLSVPQIHNFYPTFDVDKTKFLAKTGRIYRVRTTTLAPGVDTFLNVNVGGLVYLNDDRTPGVLESEVIFQVPYGADQPVVVTVTNRGQYGGDKVYTLSAEELLATPTGLPTATSTATNTPTPVGTRTATPDLRDKYEPDDVTPKSIALGESQAHNFYPQGDVDRESFLVKAGRVYEVATSGLALGVDTVLEVRVGSNVYVNDDRAPGDLSSLVQFVGPSGADVVAVVTVTNKDQYGGDKKYMLSAKELVAPSPTGVLPTPTATPTPDWRDKYEPDDVTPKPIALGETQAHNFYPNGDVDKVTFLAKAGRFYRVGTLGLALGGDTFLEVKVGGTVYTNDDRQPGDLSSEVPFQVSPSGDVQVAATVRNRGQYGADKTYSLSVQEYVPTPTTAPPTTAPPTTPPTAPTATPTAAPTPTPTPATLTSTPTATPTVSSAANGLALSDWIGADAGMLSLARPLALIRLNAQPNPNVPICTVGFVILLEPRK